MKLVDGHAEVGRQGVDDLTGLGERRPFIRCRQQQAVDAAPAHGSFASDLLGAQDGVVAVPSEVLVADAVTGEPDHPACSDQLAEGGAREIWEKFFSQNPNLIRDE
ncbi:hypothetical protein [Streptomyces sp. AHA2]|uniref:hypothetical protein n=1 Tax=Streptomyces sp. AHA2 TaxID=3064526 RepID=UPI002FDF62A3